MRYAGDNVSVDLTSSDVSRLPNFEQGPAQGPNTPIKWYPREGGGPLEGNYLPETAALPAIAPLAAGIARTQVVRDMMGPPVNDGTLDAAIRRGELGLERETMMNPPQVPLGRPQLFGAF